MPCPACAPPPAEAAPISDADVDRLVAEGEELRRTIAKRIEPMKRGPFGPPDFNADKALVSDRARVIVERDELRAKLAVVLASLAASQAREVELRRALDELSDY